MATLFTLQLPLTGGSIACTEPVPCIYLLTLTSPPDNRLTTSVCQSLLLALDILEHVQPPGVIVTTSGIQRFYSNGLDLAHAVSTEGFWEKSLFPLFRRFLTYVNPSQLMILFPIYSHTNPPPLPLPFFFPVTDARTNEGISYPMPTIAWINGHAFAGGLMLAMHHDYRIFNPKRGFLCLNELDFGVALMPAMSSIFRQKLPKPSTYRDMVLEARRYVASDALDEGLVDALGDALDDVLVLVRERDLLSKAKSSAYGDMKAEMWRESVALLDGHQANQERARDLAEKSKVEKTARAQRVDEWRRRNSIAKL